MPITRLRGPFAHRACAAVVVAVLGALVAASAASAHAMLDFSTPSNDDVLDRAPAQVVLRFNEPVETAFGSVRVYDGAARRVDEGGTTRPQSKEVAVRVRSGLPHGTYTVAWRVVSSDSHPVSGAFVFHVGKPGAGAAGVADQVLDEQSGSRAVDLSFDVVRFPHPSRSSPLSVGGAVALAFALRLEAPPVREPLWLALAAAGFLLALASLAGIGLEGAKASGLGLDAAVRLSLIRDVLDTQFGRISLARVALAVVVTAIAALALRRPRGERQLAWSASVLGVAIAITPALSGHARVAGTLAVASDSGARPGGGGRDRRDSPSSCLRLACAWRSLSPRGRFLASSELALVSVTALLLAGVVNGFLEVRSWSGLWETTYGRLLLVKVALVLPVLALGAFNNRVSVPRLRAGIASALERRRFLRAAAAELTLVVVIVGVTAVLVAEPPAKAQLAVQTGPVSREAIVGPFHLELVVDPARPGPNAIHLFLLDHATGQPPRPTRCASPPRFRPRESARPPAGGTGGPGHVVVTAATFPLVGDWRLRVDVRRGEFDQWSTTLTIPIRKGNLPTR